jgi:hypothetical protein
MKIWKQFWIGLSLATYLLSANAAAAEVGANQKQSKYGLGDKGAYSGKVFYVDADGLHGLEAKTSDEVHSMTWNNAVAVVQAYGSDWRLPTSAELLMLYKHRKLIGGFTNDDYWSATEQDVNSAWIQGFRTGDQDRYNKNSMLKVRAVRSF